MARTTIDLPTQEKICVAIAECEVVSPDDVALRDLKISGTIISGWAYIIPKNKDVNFSYDLAPPHGKKNLSYNVGGTGD